MSGQGWLASVSPVASMSNTANISQSLPRKQLEAAVWWTQSPKANWWARSYPLHFLTLLWDLGVQEDLRTKDDKSC